MGYFTIEYIGTDGFVYQDEIPASSTYWGGDMATFSGSVVNYTTSTSAPSLYLDNTTGTGYEDYMARGQVRFDIGLDPGGQFLKLADEELEKLSEREGINVLEKLLDMVFALNLSNSDVEEIKKIVGLDDWATIFSVYMVAKAVKEGLTAETLGYKEE